MKQGKEGSKNMNQKWARQRHRQDPGEIAGLWLGVGGIRGYCGAPGEPVSMRIPEVVGIRLHGRLAPSVQATAYQVAMTLTGWTSRQTRYFDSTGEVAAPVAASTRRPLVFIRT
jgi:hypothetical protein